MISFGNAFKWRFNQMKSAMFNPLDVMKQILKLTSKEIDKPSISKDKKIHAIRVMSKKLRSLLYLIKPSLQDKKFFESQNQFYKQLSKSLSIERETKVMHDTFQWLLKRNKLSQNSFENIQASLQQNQENKTDPDIDKNIEICRQAIDMALENLDTIKTIQYQIKDLEKGFQKTYEKAYDNLNLALMTRDIEDIHMFRKYAKYHMYQIQLLSNQIKYPKKRAEDLDKLTSLLGKSHDLALLADHLHDNANLTNSDTLISYAAEEQKKLTKKALKQASKLFKRNPKKLKLSDNDDD